MHWIFYVAAAAVTALAIYVQIRRIEKGSDESAAAPHENKTPQQAKKSGRQKNSRRN